MSNRTVVPAVKREMRLRVRRLRVERRTHRADLLTMHALLDLMLPPAHAGRAPPQELPMKGPSLFAETNVKSTVSY